MLPMWERVFAATERGRFEVHKQATARRLAHFSQVDFPRFNLVSHLSRVAVRSLVLCGRHDVQGPLRCSREINACLPASRLVVFPDSNRYPFLEEPSAFAAQIADFLQD